MDLNDDQFSPQQKRDMHEAEGHAIGAHLFEGVESIFGPLRAQSIGQAVNHLQANFPGHEVKWDEGDEPYHEVSQGPWSARYHAGPYIEVHHQRHGPMEVIQAPWNQETDRPGNLSHDQMKQELQHFVKHDAADYLRNAR